MPLDDNQCDSIVEAVLAAVPEPFFIFDENGTYVQIMGGVDRQRYHDGQHLVGKRIHDVMDAALADQFVDQIRRAIRSERVIHYVYQLSAMDINGSEALPGPEGRQWFEAHISPIKKMDGRPRMVVWVAFNITRLHRAISEKDGLIHELRNAIGEIKTLRGILPICSHCKRIRDDQGYWNQLEGYIQSHSEADFSHGICEECAKIYYPDYDLCAGSDR
ncbi:MAG: PAS domain-containing protein [Desulfobacterales bacterium]